MIKKPCLLYRQCCQAHDFEGILDFHISGSVNGKDNRQSKEKKREEIRTCKSKTSDARLSLIKFISDKTSSACVMLNLIRRCPEKGSQI